MTAPSAHTHTVAIITGSNTGLGYHCAELLIKNEVHLTKPVSKAVEDGAKPFHLILACRNKDKAEAAVRKLTELAASQERTKSFIIEYGILDLGSLESVRAFAKWFLEKNIPLNILLNNAGLAVSAYATTKDGLEITLGTNHFGHFLLTMLLLDKLIAAGPGARIVNVSSELHLNAQERDHAQVPCPNFDFKTATVESFSAQYPFREKYVGLAAYSSSKVANVLFTLQLAKFLEVHRKVLPEQLSVTALTPGWVPTTEFTRDSPYIMQLLMRYVFPWILPRIRTEDQGSSVLVKAAFTKEAHGQSAKYMNQFGEWDTPSADARDEHSQKNLWNCSCEIVGLTQYKL
ncbi:uncharacterized protein BJ171DRAFT_580409 [Polychytrium aggregatum]|uniref:uncharacterized protein n=1 Tax=Polychytrium aggregatum TaxID=110093 RepID=UPI0022FDBC9E|nr:uncharacterized protein BJ171DRAFT_580409 [Polychytrium aggregatum]KAI9205763.1 hypothetical protein BJ171DRAFT_580409 [Polychytrium aggregatum]